MVDGREEKCVCFRRAVPEWTDLLAHAYDLTGCDGFLALLESVHRHLTADSGEVVQEVMEGVTTFEVVEEGLKRNSRTAEHGFAAEDPGVRQITDSMESVSRNRLPPLLLLLRRWFLFVYS